jgi:hypothetical protein
MNKRQIGDHCGALLDFELLSCMDHLGRTRVRFLIRYPQPGAVTSNARYLDADGLHCMLSSKFAF